MGMCYLHGQLQLFQEACKLERIVFSGLRIAELGNQLVRESILGKGHEIPAKRIFEMLGATHVSFDTNGKDGTLPLDLSKPLPEEHRGQYDLVTNFGTTEHVEESQYWAWRNIHELAAEGAVVLHTLPEVGAWPGHGKYHYKIRRVSNLARACRSDVLIARRFEYQEDWGKCRLKHTLLYALRQSLCPFVDEQTFQRIMFPEGEPWY